MTPEQEQHLENIAEEAVRLIRRKYERGTGEHGGNLWKKKHIIDFAIDEATDQIIYLLTLKAQLKEKGIELGEIEE